MHPHKQSLKPRPALGLGHLGHCLGPLTRERPPNFGAKIFFEKKIFFSRSRKKILHFFFLLLKSAKELGNIRNNITLNTWVLQIMCQQSQEIIQIGKC